MEERKECDSTGSLLQDGTTRGRIQRFYFVKFRPSTEELEREEAKKQYHLMTLARYRITTEIETKKGDEHQINQKLKRFSLLDRYIEGKMQEIKNIERFLGKIDPRLPENEARTTLKLVDRRHCQKRLMKKGKLDIEYIQQVQKEVLSSKKCNGTTSFGTQELNDLIESMALRVQHGITNRTAEMKMFHEIRNVKETRETYTAHEPEPKNRHDWYTREIRSKWQTDYKRSAQHTIDIRLDDIETLKMAQRGRKAKTRRLKMKLELVRKTIGRLQKELEYVERKRLEAYKRAHEFGDRNEEPV